MTHMVNHSATYTIHCYACEETFTSHRVAWRGQEEWRPSCPAGWTEVHGKCFCPRHEVMLQIRTLDDVQLHQLSPDRQPSKHEREVAF